MCFYPSVGIFTHLLDKTYLVFIIFGHCREALTRERKKFLAHLKLTFWRKKDSNNPVGGGYFLQ